MFHRTCIRLSLIACLLSGVSIAQSAQRYHRVKVHTDEIPGGLAAVGALGIAVDHGDVKQGAWLVTDLSDAEVAKLALHGFRFEVVIEDVVNYYRSHNADAASGGPRDNEGCDAPLEHPLPANFSLGSMAGYYTWQEMLDILDDMAAQFPQLISVKEPIGTSIEERPIHFVRISNAPDVDQDKPEVFYNALHHAREPASLSQLIYFMWYLLENYDNDAYVQYLVDNTEFYFVPCINPDGYVYNGTTEPAGGGLWRKNRRDNGDGTFGVDLNRNYDYEWAHDDQGSSGDTGSEVYRGVAPFSEPETQAIRDFCDAHDFRLALNHHTYGNHLVYPWGYEASIFTPDSAVFATYGQLMTEENRFHPGTPDQTVGYITNGGSDDWMYGDETAHTKILAMTPESGTQQDGFWPEQQRITPICAANVDMNMRQALLAGRYAEATDRSPAILGSVTGHIVFDLTRLGLEPSSFTVGLEPLENVLSTGVSIAVPGLAVLEVHRDSITYTLEPSVSSGDVVRFVITVSNGLFTFRDTLSKTFGQPVVAFTENGNALSEWDSDDWGTTTSSFFSPPSSITDSPIGFYTDFADNALTLEQSIDLSTALAARLEFMARWDIEQGFDLTQVLASANGSSWTPLCGRYTHPGSIFQIEGEPVYDGTQNAWVAESMDLGAFIGGPVWIRFRMATDQGGSRDGFYFDDLQVVTVLSDPTRVSSPSAAIDMLESQPNPADASTMVRFTISTSEQARLVVHNGQGAIVRSVSLTGAQGRILLDTSDLAPGVYHYGLVSAQGASPLKRLVVMHP